MYGLPAAGGGRPSGVHGAPPPPPAGGVARRDRGERDQQRPPPPQQLRAAPARGGLGMGCAGTIWGLGIEIISLFYDALAL